MSKLVRLRQEREQVQNLLVNARLSADTRAVLEALGADLDRQIDQELTNHLSHSKPSPDSDAA